MKSEREPVSFSTFAQANPYYHKYSEDGRFRVSGPYSVAQEFIYNPLYQLRRVSTPTCEDLGLRNNFTVIWRPGLVAGPRASRPE